MSVCQKFSKHLNNFCHEPIQIYLASVWIMYGIFILFFGKNVITQEIPASLMGINYIWHGILLTFIGLIGFFGAIFKHRKSDFIFAAFSTFKSISLFLGLISFAPMQPEWINFFVRMVASVFLLYRSIFNITHKY